MFIYMMVILIIIFGGLYGMKKLRTKTTMMLEQVLYVEQKSTVYLELLRNPRLKLLYKRSTLLLFELDAYLFLHDEEAIHALIAICDKQPLTKGEKLDYLLKKLSYYCLNQNKLEARRTIDEASKLLNGLKGAQYQSLLEESNIIYQIYIERNTALIPQLKKQAQQNNGTQQGLIYYRLAKLYYFDNQKMNVNDCLKNAAQLLKGTTWEATVKEAMKNHTLLENE